MADIKETEWKLRENWYQGMGDACVKRHNTFLTSSFLDRLFEYDDGIEDAQRWYEKARLAQLHIRSW